MLLLAIALVFTVIACVANGRAEWFMLAILSAVLFINQYYFSSSDSLLYLIRGIATALVAVYVISRRSITGIYHGSALMVTLCAYALVEYDVITDSNIIYDSFEVWINGLVIAQLLGVFTCLRCFNDIDNTGNLANTINNQNGKIT
tara:strand:- start:2889 stop:3326 length:438 start_codon:yes stop_codon:yes gene_type:complete